MGKFNEYTQKATPADNDTLMIYDATSKANKLSPFSGIWNWIVGKLTNAVISNLQTNNQTVIGALNELNSKTTLKTYQGDSISSVFGRIRISKNLGSSKPSSIFIFGYEGVGIALFETMNVDSLPKKAVNIYGNILTQTDDGTVLVNFVDTYRQITIISPQSIEIEVESVEQ
ncbi:hypothetical protein G7B22_13050 [Blautia sp. MSK.20.9]|nr:hypothetical protein [Blautia sp. MSK.20.9]